MLKRMCVVCASLLVASTAGAATLVTWQANGTVTARSDRLVLPEPGFPIAPPTGTPVSLTFTFDPTAAYPTIGGLDLPGCQTVDVSGSVAIGDYTTSVAGSGYTRSSLPGFARCAGTNQTQFELFVPAAPADNPFKLPRGILFINNYRDLLVQDAFPNSPTTAGLVDLQYLAFGGGQFDFVFDAPATLSAIDQSAPVPEPGTMALLGLGLVAAARKRKTISSRP